MLLPRRAGPRPRTSRAMPHAQLDQTAPLPLQEEVHARALRLPHVRGGRSLVSVPGARAFHLDPAHARAPDDPFSTEFAHLHPPRDGSLHALLPAALARAAIDAGWAEPHPVAEAAGLPGLVMLYGPRDAEELEVVWSLVEAAHRHALA